MPFNPSMPLRQYPFVRLLLPFVAGIICQWYLQLPISIGFYCMIAGVAAWMLTGLLSLSRQYTLRWLRGSGIVMVLSGVGVLMSYVRNVHNDEHWFGRHYERGATVMVRLEEPLVEKAKSYKANASVLALQGTGKWEAVAGKVIVYFKKDSMVAGLGYGSLIVLHKDLQPIVSSGNPGAMDYARFCLFQGITHQVFLARDDWAALKENDGNRLQGLLYRSRDVTIGILRAHIHGKQEQAVAEALLIGYRNDLDRDLVQAYSNTGVVHIIAISGLHLAMIYGLVNGLFGVFKRKQVRWIRPLAALVILWGFTLIAGAAPSILRATVMFSCIIIGELFKRRTNMYNTLAASAFVLLLINPFYLWDVGFQLSYAAVLSIVVFMTPVYNWFYCRNPILDAIWRLNAMSLSAQVLTLPVILFHFHQFPTLFLVTNFIAVPLSGMILYGEILLLCVSWIGFAAQLIGAINNYLLWLLNSFISNTNTIPFALFDGVQVSMLQVVVLYAGILLVTMFLFYRHKMSLAAGLFCVACFFGMRAVDIGAHAVQRKIIVYNVPRYTAIDIISGDDYTYAGDTSVLSDAFLSNFHLKPGRIQNRLPVSPESFIDTDSNRVINFCGKRILLFSQPGIEGPQVLRVKVDVVVVSKNPHLSMHTIAQTFDCSEIVFDSSNPAWKTEQWKKECKDLHLRFHSVPDQGAFEMDL